MANKTIKGLTVEIGGDTTKLGKALEDVNKKSRDLSSELGSINKLLKLDPGNVELLAQKQKVLAEAVSNTEEELKTLKEAERQVQEQFQKGEASEEQVRALQREIIATEKKLSGYKNAAQETAEAVDKLGKESDDLGDNTKDTAKGADNAADSLDDMGDAAKDAENNSGNLGETLKGAAKAGLAAVAAAAAAVGAALIGAAEETREYRNEMGKLDTAFTTNGHSSEAATKTYKSLQGILGETDQAVEAANHLAKLTDNEKDLETWTDICTGVYATFGASLPIEGLTEAANETAKTGQLTGSLADALNWAGVNEEQFQAQLDACSNEQERQALITETLNGLYSETADKYREVNEEIIRANEANEAWTSSMAEVGGAIEPILTDVKLLGASMLSDLVPGVKGVAEAFRGLLNGDEGAADALGASLSGLITELLTKITELAPTLVQVALSLITTLATTLISMLPQLVETGVTLILSVIQGIASALPQIASAIAAMIPQLVSTLSSAIPQIISALVSLVSIVADSLDQILPPLIQAIPTLIMALVNGILDNLPVLLDGIIQTIMMLVGYLDDIIAAILPLIPQIITAICESLAENLPIILNAILDLIILLGTEVLPKIIWEILKMIPQLLASILGGLGQILASLVEWAGSLFVRLGKWLAGIGSSIGQWFSEIWSKFTSWLSDLGTKAKTGAKNLVDGFINFIKELPGKIASWFNKTVDKVKSFGTNAVAKAKEAAKNIFDGIANKIKELPDKIKQIGSDIVKGLWNGIKDMTKWVTDKIKGFGENVLGGIKDFFGIKSPSRVFRDEVGKMLAEGLAVGIEDNADAPLDAMADLSQGVLDEANGLNGLTLERQLNHTFSTEPSASEVNFLSKLDSILAAIEAGQFLLLDGDTLVGGTADRMNRRLGQIQLLTAKGAL